ncbi:MAG: Rpn family recombination-promoting nuclease/putative transposase [Chloroflexi bacterium]|nr:Rpn family recombination-promoting nuclease/putative transposase [Chloroflexota bacterium]MBP8059279.1 Rpn family recombination-promoting nuclease/putative transposase [Chloroflexota bacterium]
MAKSADIGSKRLISLNPVAWVRWLTGDHQVDQADLLSGEFQWISRANDALLKVHSPVHGTFLVPNEIQLRPDIHAPQRMRAYAALGEEKFHLPTFPVLINILPPAPGTLIASQYHSQFMGLTARQDFKVINLWEVDVNLVFDENLTSLLPFVPILDGGSKERVLQRAVYQLRAEQSLNELEPLLAFFATFVLQLDIVQRIMRWDMAILRESPWYNEILKEGLEQGLKRGRKQGILQAVKRLWQRRFGEIPYLVHEQLRFLSADALQQVFDETLDAETLEQVQTFVQKLSLSQTREQE